MVNSKSNLQWSSRVNTFPAFLYPQLLLLNVAQDYSAPSLWESMQFNCSELLCIFPLSHQLFARKVAAVSFDSLAVCGQLEGTSLQLPHECPCFASSPVGDTDAPDVYKLRSFPPTCSTQSHPPTALHGKRTSTCAGSIFLSSLQAG